MWLFCVHWSEPTQAVNFKTFVGTKNICKKIQAKIILTINVTQKILDSGILCWDWLGPEIEDLSADISS